MPPVPIPAEQYFFHRMAVTEQRLSAIETNQQSTLTDAEGRPVVNIGLAPASNPAQYGIQLVNPATGGQLAMFGVQEDGTTSQSFFDGSGNLRTKIDSAGQHFYDGAGNQLVTIDSAGLHVWNTSGVEVTRLDGAGFHSYSGGAELTRIDTTGMHSFTSNGAERVRAGQLVSGDYGLQVIDTTGASQEILPAVEQYVATLINVSSTTYVSDGGPSVSAVVGASGKVKLDATAQIISNTASDGAYVGLAIDGTINRDLLWCYSAGGQTVATCAATVIITGLSAGSHTFEMQYRHSSGTNPADFQQRSLVVTPI